MVTNQLIILVKKKTYFFKLQFHQKDCKCQISCISYLLCQMYFQVQPELPLIFFVGFPSSASSASPATLDHSSRLSELVRRVLPGYTHTPEHIGFFMSFVPVYIRKVHYVKVPVGCHARLRTTDFKTNCPVVCH